MLCEGPSPVIPYWLFSPHKKWTAEKGAPWGLGCASCFGRLHTSAEDAENWARHVRNLTARCLESPGWTCVVGLCWCSSCLTVLHVFVSTLHCVWFALDLCSYVKPLLKKRQNRETATALKASVLCPHKEDWKLVCACLFLIFTGLLTLTSTNWSIFLHQMKFSRNLNSRLVPTLILNYRCSTFTDILDKFQV